MNLEFKKYRQKLTVVHVVHPRFEAPDTRNFLTLATPISSQKSVTASIALKTNRKLKKYFKSSIIIFTSD